MCNPSGWLGGHGNRQPSQEFLDWRTAKRDWRDARPQRPEGGFEDREARQAFRQERHDWRDARPVRPEGITGGSMTGGLGIGGLGGILTSGSLGGALPGGLGGLMRHLGKGLF
jgi:hypothetical protein